MVIGDPNCAKASISANTTTATSDRAYARWRSADTDTRRSAHQNSAATAALIKLNPTRITARRWPSDDACARLNVSEESARCRLQARTAAAGAIARTPNAVTSQTRRGSSATVHSSARPRQIHEPRLRVKKSVEASTGNGAAASPRTHSDGDRAAKCAPAKSPITAKMPSEFQ